MLLTVRIFLVGAAALCGGFFASLVAGFGAAVEPGSYEETRSFTWVVLSAVLGWPFWLPAVIPNRFPRLLCALRRIGAAYAVLGVVAFGSIVSHNIVRHFSGLGATPSALLEGVVLTSVCLLCLILLLWPDLWKDKPST